MSNPSGLGLEDARKALSAQPFSNLLDAHLVSFSPSETVLEIAAGSDARQQHGYVHGGVVAYAADNAMAFSAGTVLGPQVVSSSLNVQFVRAAKGPLLRARAEVVHSTARQVVAHCVVEDVDPGGTATQCAIAQGTFALTPRFPAGDGA